MGQGKFEVLAEMTTDEPGARAEGLHAAAGANHPHRVVELLDGGAAPDEFDPAGSAPLHYAAATGAYEAARALIDRRADVDIQDAKGRTPLLIAVESFDGQGSFIELLRFAGANPHAADVDGRTPVAVAREAGGAVARYFASIRELPVIPVFEDEQPEASDAPPQRRGLDRLGWRRST